MSSFSDYAPYYDLFYRGKDYAAESAFVLGLLRERNPGVKSILELGCGTGGHAVHFAEAGCEVLGVDLSRGMIEHAHTRFRSLPVDLCGRFRGLQGDAANFTSPEKVDAVVSLFHVASYQTTNQNLMGYFRSAASALHPGGLFLFDFWYGPAVLSERPQARVRQEVADDGTLVIRETQPVMRLDENVVDVNYRFVLRGNASERSFSETHRMRYLFLPEIRMFAAATGFTIQEAGGWMSRVPLGESTWYGWVCLTA